MSVGMQSGYSNITSITRGNQPYLGGNRNKQRSFAKAESYGLRIRKSNLPPSMTSVNSAAPGIHKQHTSIVSTNVSTRPIKKHETNVFADTGQGH